MDRLRGRLKFDYDRVSDVLYSYVNRPRRAYAMKAEHGVVLRVDPDSEKLVGFTVTGYSDKLRRGVLDTIPHFGHLQLPKP